MTNNIFYALKDEASESNCFAVVAKTNSARTHNNLMRALHEEFDTSDILVTSPPELERCEHGRACTFTIAIDGDTTTIEVTRTFLY